MKRACKLLWRALARLEALRSYAQRHYLLCELPDGRHMNSWRKLKSHTAIRARLIEVLTWNR